MMYIHLWTGSSHTTRWRVMAGPLAVVTGGGRGIGAAVSERLAKDGYRVLLTYHTSSHPAEEVVGRILAGGSDGVAVKVDCSDSGEVALLADHPWVKNGVDVLVLNHGRYDRMPAQDLSHQRLRQTMATNFEGAFLVWEAVRPFLVDDAGIIVVGSQLGIRGSPHGADYSASKGALHAWARSLAQAVGPLGQRVNVIAPGFVDTAILAGDSAEKREQRESEVPLRRIGQPEDIAAVVSFLASSDSSYVSGAVIHVNGGLFLP